MNAVHTAPKEQSIATYGLGGCIAGYIDNGGTHTMFHFDPTVASRISSVLDQAISENTRGVTFVVPQVWEKKQDGTAGYEKMPDPNYVNRLLAPPILFLKHRNIPFSFCCYDCCCEMDTMRDPTQQGTFWVEKNGKLFMDGRPIVCSIAQAGRPAAVVPERTGLVPAGAA